MSEEIKEEVKSPLLDEKKLTTIMKRFLGTKESDPDVTKYYKVENGINYIATTFGSAAQIHFQNNFDGTYTKGTGKDFFRKPLPNSKFEDVDFIPEMETITEGKKKIKQPTGNVLEFPDVTGMFNKFNLTEFYNINLPIDDIDSFISVHEAMEKASKIGGMYNTAELSISLESLTFRLHDSPIKFEWTYHFNEESNEDFVINNYHYDFSLMTAILKSLKDLKLDGINMYAKDKDHPILFIGNTLEYNFKFAINRKMVR